MIEGQKDSDSSLLAVLQAPVLIYESQWKLKITHVYDKVQRGQCVSTPREERRPQ